MAQVFISYSRKDEAFAQRLAAVLTEQKREVWLDRKDIELTADWKQRVLRGIEGANAFICVVSPDYAASAVCREEAEHAVANNKRLVPLLRRPVDFSKLHPAIAAINALPFAVDDDFDAGVSKLIVALDTDFDWLDQHTRLLRRAHEWEGKMRDKSLILRGNDLRAAELWLTQAGSARERNPTQLQTEYILTSRRASNRRLRVLLCIAAAVVGVTIVLAAVASVQRGVAIQRTREVEQSFSRSDFLEATRRLAANETGAAFAHLARALRKDRHNGSAQQRLVSLLSQRDWQFPALDPLDQDDFVSSADVSPDGKRIVTSCGVGMVQLWDAERGERIGGLLRFPSLTTATFSPDGSKIAVICELNVGETSARGRWQLLDGATGKPLADAVERTGEITAAAFTSDSEQLLIGLRIDNGAGEVCVSDVKNGGSPLTLLSFKDAVPVAFDTVGARVIALARDPKASNENNIARVWNLRTGKPTTIPFKHNDEIKDATFSPDGAQIATWTWLKARAFVWNLAPDRLAFSTHPASDDLALSEITYSPDSRLLVAVHVGHPSRETDWAVQVHDAKTGEPVRGEIRDHGRFASAVFSPDSQFLLLCSSGQRARVWRARTSGQSEEEEAVAPLEHSDVVMTARMTPDGRRIVTGSFDKTVRVWQATPGLGRALSEKLVSAHPVFFAEASSRGARIATISAEPPGVQIWDAATRQPISQFLPLQQMEQGARFTGDERLLIARGDDGIHRVWDANSGQFLMELKHPSGAPIESALLNCDGSRAVTATKAETVLWDLTAGRTFPLAIEPAQRSVPSLQFTPDGARLLTVCEGQVNLWDAETGARVWGPIAHSGRSETARFSPDGRRFALFGMDTVVSLFDTATGTLEHSLPHRGLAGSAVFSADGRLVATCSFVLKTSGYTQVWDAASGAAITQPLVGEDELHEVTLSPDGTLVCATERSGRARVWSIATGRECIDPLPHDTSAWSAWFSSDGKRLLTVADGALQFHELWDLGVPVPLWLPDLAEAIGGFAVNDNGVAVAVEHQLQALEKVRAAIAAASGDDPHLKWARWFFADRRQRTISPFSERTMSEKLATKP